MSFEPCQKTYFKCTAEMRKHPTYSSLSQYPVANITQTFTLTKKFFLVSELSHFQGSSMLIIMTTVVVLLLLPPT